MTCRDCSTLVPVPPPTSRHNPFSACSRDRNFSLFARVIAAGLFTSGPAIRPKSALSRPVLSEPVHLEGKGEQV